MASKRPSMKKKAVRRRERAVEIDAARASRTASEQLVVLDKRLGVGIGAVKERARLQAEIEGKKK